MVQTISLLLIIVLLGVVGRNYTVATAAGFLLAMRVMHAESYFPWLQKNALNAGIAIITVAILVPFATGEIDWYKLFKAVFSSTGLIALTTGVLVAYLGGRGVGLLTIHPQVMVGLMVGTIVGVAFFRGVPVGPLIAAGMMAVVLGFINK